MSIRREVEDLVDAGAFPSEEAAEEEIAETQRLLERITAPVTVEEAQVLTKSFGFDDCYGLSWTLLHLIETAPNAMTAVYSENSGNPWVELLNARVENARKSHS
ncbi:hypothetical protein [Streptomyces sp. Z26]|uniref:hypothetical protein n=1 Tax=Streptomyces sp. Z26 TaxID=2500177 RepID=UPI000F260B33|nr:hypothetical protein [Streptomyces sp. Z26]RLL67631.1 hypothetical protein D7M15_13125 [Streptomyces sp. Z26]